MRHCFFLLTLCLAFTAQAKMPTAFVYGRFEGNAPKTITMQFYASILDQIESHNTKLEVTLGDDKSFSFEVPTGQPLNFHLLRDENWIFYNKYIAPGDTLHFVFSDSSILVDGPCEDVMDFQFAYDARFNNKDSIKVYQDAWKLAPHDFAAFMRQRHDAHIAYLNEYFKGKKIPEVFKRTFTADEDLDFAVDIVQFSWRSKAGKLALTDTAFWAYLGDISTNNPDNFLSHRYSYLLRELPYGIHTTLENVSENNPALHNYYVKNSFHIRDSIAKIYFKGYAYDYALYHLFNDDIREMERSKGTAGFDAAWAATNNKLKLYRPQFANHAIPVRIEQRLAALKEKETPAPDFTVQDMSGKPVKLSGLKGKVVYIDFWATNCAPCVAELPHIRKMHERYKDNNNIVLLYVSFDHKPTLEKFLQEKDFPGLHWIEPKGLASDVANRYNISGIPRYILVDKKGNLVTKDAPRPSESPYQLIDAVLAR